MTAEQSPKQAINRTGRAAASIVSGSLFGVCSTLLGFWATPAILRALGSQTFGLARALSDVFAYLALLEFGLPGASRALLATELASDVPDRTSAAFAMTLRAYGRATIWKLCGAVVLIVLCPLILRVGQHSAEMRLGAAILAFSMLGTPIGALQALLSAEQREYANNLTIGTQNIIMTCSAVGFAWLRWGIPGQMAAQALGIVFLCVALALLTRKALLASRGVQVLASEEKRIAFVRMNRSTFWRMLAGRLAITSDRVTVGIMLGGNAVTGFHATVRLTDAILPHLLGVGNGAWPAMVDIHNRGEARLFAKRLCEVTTTICGAAVALTAPIFTVNRAFVDIWLGPGIFAGWALTVACCINVAFISLVSFWEWCFQCTQKVEALVPVTVIACLANVIASVAGTWLLGSAGPAIGTASSMALIVIPWEVRLISVHFGVSPLQLILSMAKPLVLAFPYLFACHWAGMHWLTARWVTIALFAAVSAGGWLVIAWFTVFDRETRQAWRGRIGRLRNRLV